MIMQHLVLAGAFSEALAPVRQVMIVVFAVLCLALILFVLFRQADSTGLAAAFGGGGSGEGAFGAHSQKVADKVIAWMCGLFIVLSLMIAVAGTSQTDLGGKDKATDNTEKPAE